MTSDLPGPGWVSRGIVDMSARRATRCYGAYLFDVLLIILGRYRGTDEIPFQFTTIPTVTPYPDQRRAVVSPLASLSAK
ncbi:hypothetical protein BVI2075_150062 [Burkholderia vietnamiensis]|nr:hypothetical protein BVI2075_150062 [Burkholderia vietnamiensis]